MESLHREGAWVMRGALFSQSPALLAGVWFCLQRWKFSWSQNFSLFSIMENGESNTISSPQQIGKKKKRKKERKQKAI
jgi:hypothetical protein